ncbi:4258_t:CDS:2 [Ambispora gerdemannii]|uniref:4258_t:CDS:1 n=1 Tax=Ambispora gerdemannii TaxID=144530 RepID=A0A9N8WC40_9GLOM|nr:4258_t:CDS:2 [Ambispora gerdemannii]
MDLYCQNFAIRLIHYRDRQELHNTQNALQTAEATNQNLHTILEVPDMERSFMSGSSTDDSHYQRLEEGLERALEPGQKRSHMLDEILEENNSYSENSDETNNETQYFDTNSPDTYNQDINMATIPELANAIDGYLTPQDRQVLQNQIKQTTRQIRRKYDTQQQIIADLSQQNRTRRERREKQAYKFLCDYITRDLLKYQQKYQNEQALQQYLALVNNQLLNQNMAEARRLPTLKYVSTLLKPIPQYMGQMPLNDYCDMVIQAWAPAVPNMTALETANAQDFDDVKCEIIKERFQPFDTPDTYETRIRPLLGVANDDARILGTIKTYLSGDRELYSWMRTENPADQNHDQVQSGTLVPSYEKKNLSQAVSSSYNEMQKSFQAMLDKRDAEQKAEIEKRDAKHNTEMEKLKAEEEALQWLDKAFPPPIATKPERLRSSNQNDRIESKVDEIGQMTSQFGRMVLDNQPKNL